MNLEEMLKLTDAIAELTAAIQSLTDVLKRVRVRLAEDTPADDTDIEEDKEARPIAIPCWNCQGRLELIDANEKTLTVECQACEARFELDATQFLDVPTLVHRTHRKENLP